LNLIPTRLHPVLAATLSFAQPAINTLAAPNRVRKATSGASLKIHRRETPGLPALQRSRPRAIQSRNEEPDHVASGVSIAVAISHSAFSSFLWLPM
jgi:hypothetical protein